MSHQRYAICALALAISACVSTSAQAIQVVPGQWEMQYHLTMPTLAGPRDTSLSECILVQDLGPEELTSGNDGSCQIIDVIHEGNSLSWSMSCAGPGGPATGSWTFHSEGAALRGEGHIQMKVSGKDMPMSMSMTGQRVGDCNH